MKKQFVTLLFLFPLALVAQNAPGSPIANAGFGLGIYRTTNLDKQSNISEKDTAGAWVFPLMIEYFPKGNAAIFNRLGLGAGFKYSNYIEGKKDSGSTLGVNAFDLQLKPAFHFVNGKRVDLSVHGLIGASYISYRSNSYNDVKGNGFAAVFGAGLNGRIYFGNVFGMYIDYTYHSFTYNDIKITDTYGNKADYKVGFKGGNVTLGLVFRIN